MFCGKCGAEVEDAAKFCRACGTAIGESPTPARSKRGTSLLGWLMVLVGMGAAFTPARILPAEAATFVGFVLLWIGFSVVFPGSSRIVRMGKGVVGALVIAAPSFYVRDVARGTDSPNREAAVAQEVALDTLVSDYKANEVAADQRYKGHWIQTSGVLTSISKDIAGSPFVLVGTGNETELRQVQCSLANTAVAEAARLSAGAPVTVQGRVNGLMLNVQLGNCTFAEKAAPATATAAPTSAAQPKQPATETVAAIAAASSAPATSFDWKSAVRATAELATMPATETSTGRAWDDVATKLSGLTWADASDNEFAVIKRAFIPQGMPTRTDVDAKPGFTITLKGARTMVLETDISLFNPGDINPGLVELFAAAVPNQLVRCDSDEGATFFERWYRVMPAGSKPLFAHVTSTSGSAGTTETVTFDPNAKLPTMGDEAINGKWTDRCKP